MPSWLTRYLQPREGLLSLGLLVVMVLTLGWAVQAAGWLPQLDFLVPVALYAALAGAILGLTSLSVTLTLPAGALVGAAVVLWMVGGEYYADLGQAGRLMALHDDAIGWLSVIVRAGYPPQLSPYAIGLGVLIWSVAFIAAYTLFRHHRVLDAILLVGAALIANMSATFADLFIYLVIFMLAALLLWLRGALVAREEGWQRRRVNENVEVPASITRTGLTFIVVSMTIAWVLTSFAVASPLTGAWRSLDSTWASVRDRFDTVFGSLANPEARITGASFGSKFAVAGSWVSNDTPVLTMAATRPYYLETVTYDTYTGRGWSRSDGTSRSVPAAQAVVAGPTPERPTVAENFSVERVAIQFDKPLGRNLFTPGYPQKVYAPAVVHELGGGPLLGGLDAANPINAGQGYEISAVTSQATEGQLAGAGTSYPAAIRQYFLSTDHVSKRTAALARDIVNAAGATDPYHMAKALADYLATDASFTYSTKVALPTDPNQDLVDYFLFDPTNGRQGFCQFYATAMAMMARSLGLPARVAAGFAPGERLAAERYQYREKNAHLWAEIYFPAYGWQIFEATKTIDPKFSRLTGTAGSTPPPNPVGPDRGAFDPNSDTNTKIPKSVPSFEPVSGGFAAGGQPPVVEARTGNALIIVALVLVALGFGLWRLRRIRRRLRFLAPADRQWVRLALAAERAGVSQRPYETPYEYAGWLEEQIPSRGSEIRTIADGKVWQDYSGRAMTDDAVGRVERAWRRLRLPLAWLAVRHRARTASRRRRA